MLFCSEWREPMFQSYLLSPSPGHMYALHLSKSNSQESLKYLEHCHNFQIFIRISNFYCCPSGDICLHMHTTKSIGSGLPGITLYSTKNSTIRMKWRYSYFLFNIRRVAYDDLPFLAYFFFSKLFFLVFLFFCFLYILFYPAPIWPKEIKNMWKQIKWSWSFVYEYSFIHETFWFCAKWSFLPKKNVWNKETQVY